jgi:Carboxypeptidase regulatory-like domain/TonB-dependent Receptor Plug Domain
MVASLIAIALFALPCHAGETPITGAVKDALGRPVPDASVELRSANGAIMAHGVTDNLGRFIFALHQAGLYSLVATKQGFQAANKVVAYPTHGGEPITITLGARTALTVPVEADVIRGQNGVSSTGANKYTVTAQDIQNLPRGENTTITDVLLQMPGVSLDQNQQIHIRNTEGPQFQYQINGVMVPLDIVPRQHL